MTLHMVGCSHHQTALELRERIAFSPEQVPLALSKLREQFPKTEAVLLSTCNRTELYTAAEDLSQTLDHGQVAKFFAEFHGLSPLQFLDDLWERTGEQAVRHLFTVAASLDSMVVGEAQILSQVKQAYQLAREGEFTGPLTHSAFQAAIRVAKRVASETAIHQKRVSIPSVAVGDFAQSIFERLDDKKILLIGAGQMAEETLQYLIGASATHVTMVNRNEERAAELASRFSGQIAPWTGLREQLVGADLVISTTGAPEPIVTLDDYRAIEPKRFQRPLFVLDLAVPRDFDPRIGEKVGVYLYSIDDLRQACEANRKSREKEWPLAEKIIQDETQKFMSQLHHRSSGPTIQRLKANADDLKDEELRRLLNKLAAIGPVNEQSAAEIRKSFDRLINKILHPPLASLRDEAESGMPHNLLDALRRLFQLKE